MEQFNEQLTFHVERLHEHAHSILAFKKRLREDIANESFERYRDVVKNHFIELQKFMLETFNQHLNESREN